MMLFVVLDLGNVKIGAACGIAPTLRTEREEWGTHFVGCVRVIERLGHPPQNARTGHPSFRSWKRGRRIRSVGHPSILKDAGIGYTLPACAWGKGTGTIPSGPIFLPVPIGPIVF